MSLSLPDLKLARELTQLAAEAGMLVRGLSAAGLEIRSKSDSSPVTQADERAEEMILSGLSRLLPGVPVLAEENTARGVVPDIASDFIAVDALDGTRDYVAGRPEYTVNIGIILSGRPVFGVICAPALGRIYRGLAGQGAARADFGPVAALREEDFVPITTRPPAAPPVALTSRGHNDAMTEAFLNLMGAKERLRMSSSLKFALVAEGAADIYARFAGTMEWDTAAGEAILSAAGGQVLTPEGTPLAYGKTQTGFCNGPLIGWGRAPA